MFLAPNIRLKNQSEGYIEIKNGSTWSKVVEENWDKEREKMLCQHLGFKKINGNNSIETRQLGSGKQIVTGDLICYNAQSSGTSCCVHLKPSISTTSTMIPHVRCKPSYIHYESPHKPTAFILFIWLAKRVLYDISTKKYV